MSDDKPRVTGVGGIFFKSKNPDKMKALLNGAFLRKNPLILNLQKKSS